MKILGFIVVFLLISGCSPIENTIGSPNSSWKLLMATNEYPSKLVRLNLPENIVASTDVYFSGNGRQMTSTATRIKIFRDFVFIFQPESHSLEILSQSRNYKSLAVLNFSQDFRTPSDIAFANATTAFLAFGDDSVVGVLDITDSTTLKITQYINVGKNPIAITASGNQIFTANKGDNSVSQIDSRTNSVLATIQLSATPLFLEPNTDGTEIVVVCKGENFNDYFSKAVFIDALTGVITAQTLLYDSGKDSSFATPHGLAVTANGFAFVTIYGGILLRLDVRNRTSVRSVLNGNFQNIIYNSIRNELMLLNPSGNKFSIADPTSGALNNNFSLNTPVTCILAE